MKLFTITTFFWFLITTSAFSETDAPTTSSGGTVPDSKPISVQRIEALPEFSIGSLRAAILTDKLGSNKRTHIYSTDNSTRYFYEPALLPEWADYERKVRSVCVPKFDLSTLGYPARIAIDRFLDRQLANVQQRSSELISYADSIRDEKAISEYQRVLLNSTPSNLPKTMRAFKRSFESAGRSALRVEKLSTFKVTVPDPDAAKFGLEFSSLGIEPENELPNEPEKTLHRISLKIFLDSPEYRTQIKETLNKYRTALKSEANVTDYNIFVIPYDLVRIILNLEGAEQVVFASDNQYRRFGDGVFTRPKSFALDSFTEIDLELNCDQHLQILAEKGSGNRSLLEGELYRTGAVFSRSSIYFASSIGVFDEVKAELFADEETKIESSQTGGGATASLSIPLIGSVGGGINTATQSLDAERLISRDLFQGAVRRSIAKSSAFCTGNLNCFEAVKGLVDRVYDTSLGEAALVRKENGQYSIVKDQIEYFTITNSTIQADLDQKFKNKVDTSTTVTPAPAAGATPPAGAAPAVGNTLGTDTATDLAGKIGATNIPVAVTGKLAVVSRSSIDRLVDLEIVSRLPIEGRQRFFFPFHYPAYGYRDGIITTEQQDALKREEAAAAAELMAQCKANFFRQESRAPASQSFRGRKPRGWTSPATAIARQGFYISSWKGIITSSHNGQAATSNLALHADNFQIDGKNAMHQSASVRFYCKRGRSIRKRTCTASGYVLFSEQPVKCAPHLITGYAAMKSAAAPKPSTGG